MVIKWLRVSCTVLLLVHLNSAVTAQYFVIACCHANRSALYTPDHAVAAQYICSCLSNKHLEECLLHTLDLLVESNVLILRKKTKIEFHFLKFNDDADLYNYYRDSLTIWP